MTSPPPAEQNQPDRVENLDENLATVRFPVVGIGASAGGLDAFRKLLSHLPTDTGMAFVLIQHLDPNHKSLLREILAQETTMPVVEVLNDLAVEPNCVYVIPPNTKMEIEQGLLKLTPREKSRIAVMPVDTFFLSLAAELGNKAIAVVLSGGDGDGSQGLAAIKEAGGITFAQCEDSAQVSSMPNTAVATGHVDFILRPEQIAAELANISRHPYLASPTPAKAVEVLVEGETAMQAIFSLLQAATKMNFNHYKQATLKRRISRRMVLYKMENIDNYVTYLREHSEELQALSEDMLIHVTSFFRDPIAFEALKTQVFPHIANKGADVPIRIWIAGCATGEEAYSIAICLLEYLETQPIKPPIQIYATDISDRAIDVARAGFYKSSILANVSPERLQRFFVPGESGYQICKSIREMCVFAKQNICSDPPFSKLDLISCRNVLIYLGAAIQKKILPTFHYGLKPTGCLLLGISETTGDSSDLFTVVDKKQRIYARKLAPARLTLDLITNTHTSEIVKSTPSDDPDWSDLDLQKEADRIVIERFAPVGVVIDNDLEIVHFRGQTSLYLESAPGRASHNLLKMAKDGLKLELRTAIYLAKQQNSAVSKEDLQITDGALVTKINFEVIPLKARGMGERYFLVIFQAATPAAIERSSGLILTPRSTPTAQPVTPPSGQEMARLTQELATTQDYLRTIVEEQEATNQDLRAANEEILSSNEEFQSSNEELETAKEEIQATNEELNTLNDELQRRNHEVTEVSNDLENLISSTNIPILMLSSDLSIRRFTPLAQTILHLIPTDVGRPLRDINHALDLADLESQIRAVISTLKSVEQEVQDRDGHWYDLHIRPYRTLDNKIDGAMLILVDIDALKRSMEQLEHSRNYAQAIVETVREPLIVLDRNLRVFTANQSFYDTFEATSAETEQRLIFDLGNGQWNIPKLQRLLLEVIPTNSELQDFEVEHNFDRIGTKTMLLNAWKMTQSEGGDNILLAIEDITERKQAEQILQRAAKFDAFRITLADALRPIADPVEIQAAASRVLGEYLGANRVVYFDISGTDYVVERDYVNGATPLNGRYPIDSFSAKMLAAHRAGRTVSVSDVNADPDLPPEQKAAYAALQIGAYIDIPLVKGGEFIAGLAVYSIAPRVWTPDEVTLVEEVAERTWAAIERTHAEAALRESEAKYRTLFESMDEGYVLMEMIFDADDRPIDFCYLDANPAAVKMLGENPTGRSVWEVNPQLEAHWLETLGRVAQTGIGERHELEAPSFATWYNFYVFKIGNTDSRQVAVIFDDVTVRKRREANLAFLTEIQDEFTHLVSPDEIMQAVGEKVGAYLNIAQCVFAEIDRDRDRATVEYDWHNPELPDLIGVYQLSDFVSEEFQRAAQAKETIVINNTQTDARTDTDRYAAFNIHAFASVPFHRGNEWKYLLTINDLRTREWREDEIELISELANRIFPRLERARAEATVAANLRDTQLLRELGARLVSEDDIHTLYREILATAIALTGADAGTLQIFDERTQDLCTIASQGIESSLVTHFARVDASSDTPCGIALSSGTRSVVDFDAPHPDPHGSMQRHVEAGLLSAQSTPLISRTGKAIGMVSTHWRTRYRASERQLQFLDLLARQAADLLEQRQTIEALREREEQLRLATAASKLGMWFWNLDTDTLTWTEQCKAMFGLPADTDMSYEIFMATLHPDDRQRTHAAVTRSIAERAEYDIESRCCWPDGTVHWIAAKGSCTYDTTGTPTRMLGVAIDITERKQVEEALRASEAQLAEELADMQQLQQISSQLIREDNSDALYEQIVDAAIALMRSDMGSVQILDPDRQMLRLLTWRGLHPAAVERWQWVNVDSTTSCGTALSSGERASIPDVEACDFLAGTADLDAFRLFGIAAAQSTPLISRNGRIVGMITTHWRTPHQPTAHRLRLLDVLARQVADLFDRQQAEATLAERARQLADLNSRLTQSEIQLQERNQELDSFVYIVSHDLKAPLRAVSNLSQWIEEDFQGAVSAHTTEQMNLLRSRVHRMEDMIAGLLEYARVGRQDSQLDLVAVGDLLTEVIESIAPPPTFKIDIASQMPALEANRLLLSQVFANLISNAFKHHDRSDGCIRVSSRELGEFSEFAICDDGPGIAPEQHERVFVIFQAVNPQKHPDSTGIGLSIVKKIVETAGGRIWLESELGKGTTFYFTWPMRLANG